MARTRHRQLLAGIGRTSNRPWCCREVRNQGGGRNHHQGGRKKDFAAPVFVCIASGPSLTREDCEKVRESGLKTIVVNDNYRIAPWADYLYACDRSWWKVHYSAVKESFCGELWTQDKAWNNDFPEGLSVIESADGVGLSDDPSIIHQGANSGYQAINLAYHFGAKTILLLGYDMSGVGTHWFGKHEGEGLSGSTDYSGLVSKFATIKPEKHGIEIINCSRHTALEFPRVDLDEALRQASGSHLHRPKSGQAA